MDGLAELQRQLKTNVEMLQEAFAYLLRLPVVPTTVEMARKLRAHLDDPSLNAALSKARDDERIAALRQGASYSTSGLLVVKVEVSGSAALVSTAQLESSAEHESLVFERLRQGELVELARAIPGTDENYFDRFSESGRNELAAWRAHFTGRLQYKNGRIEDVLE